MLEKKYVIQRILCLDMDGTVRRSKSGKQFIEELDDIELMPGIEKVIWNYKNTGYIIAIVTNQGGIAYGHKDYKQVQTEINYTINLFVSDPFDVVKICPSMEGGTAFPYNMKSLFRKPYIGMLAALEDDFSGYGIVIDWNNSLMVGDRPEDEDLAKNAGIAYQHITDFLTKPQVITIQS